MDYVVAMFKLTAQVGRSGEAAPFMSAVDTQDPLAWNYLGTATWHGVTATFENVCPYTPANTTTTPTSSSTTSSSTTITTATTTSSSTTTTTTTSTTITTTTTTATTTTTTTSTTSSTTTSTSVPATTTDPGKMVNWY